MDGDFDTRSCRSQIYMRGLIYLGNNNNLSPRLILSPESLGEFQTPNGDIAKAIVSCGYALVKSLLGVFKLFEKWRLK